MGSKTNRKVKSPKAFDVVTVEEVKEEKAEEAKEAGMFPYCQKSLADVMQLYPIPNRIELIVNV